MRNVLVALAAAVAFVACSPEEAPSDLDPSWPAVEPRFRIGDGGPECDGPRQHEVAEDGSMITCTWDRVTVDGEPRCLAIVVFERENAEAPWSEPTVFVTHATVCPDEQDAP